MKRSSIQSYPAPVCVTHSIQPIDYRLFENNPNQILVYRTEHTNSLSNKLGAAQTSPCPLQHRFNQGNSTPAGASIVSTSLGR